MLCLMDADYLDISRNLGCLVLVVRENTLFPQAEEPLKASLRRLNCELFHTTALKYFINFIEMVDVI